MGASNSAVLGSEILGRLRADGIEISEFVIKASIRSQDAQELLVEEVRKADVVLLSFPLYVDSIPTLMTEALEILHERRSDLTAAGSRKRVFAICNCGFPEGFQTIPALAIVERFATKAGMHYAGGLMLGAGEALVHEAPLAGPRNGMPPVFHVEEALRLAATALAQGSDCPDSANRKLASSPIPLVPFFAWRSLYCWVGDRIWNQIAAKHGLKVQAMRARPFVA